MILIMCESRDAYALIKKWIPGANVPMLFNNNSSYFTTKVVNGVEYMRCIEMATEKYIKFKSLNELFKQYPDIAVQLI